MGKKIVEVWTSDVVPSVEFESREDKENFDKDICSLDRYLELAKDWLENKNEDDILENIRDNMVINRDENGCFIIEVDTAYDLYDDIRYSLDEDGFWNFWDWDAFTVGVTNGYDEIPEDVLDDINTFILDKLKEFKNEINALVKFKSA